MKGIEQRDESTINTFQKVNVSNMRFETSYNRETKDNGLIRNNNYQIIKGAQALAAK